MIENLLWLWLCSRPGLYYNGIHRLYTHYQSIEKIYEAIQEGEAQKIVGQYYEKKWRQIFKKEEMSLEYIREYERELEKKEIYFVHIFNADYPKTLKMIENRPYGLFCKGDRSCLRESYLSVAGTRNPSSYGLEMARYIGERLGIYQVPVVSGMALGIDGYIQGLQLKYNVPTIAVLGHGVDICYPQKNWGIYQQISCQGLLVSEFPPKTKPLAFHFPLRNRIMAGIGQALLIIEAGLKSGTSHSVEYALGQGKDVYCIPSPMNNLAGRGSNQMILEGAEIICSWEQLYQNIEKLSKGKENIQCNKGKERNIKEHIESNQLLVYSKLELGSISLKELVLKTKLSELEVRHILMILERKGLCKEVYHQYFIKL